MRIHQYVTRGQCSTCRQFFWTTPGTDSIRCACGRGLIENNVLVSGVAITDEAEFDAAVAIELRVDVADLIVEKV